MPTPSTVLISAALVLGSVGAPPSAQQPSLAPVAAISTVAVAVAGPPQVGTDSHWRHICRLLGICD